MFAPEVIASDFDERLCIAQAADGDAAAREQIARTWTPRIFRFVWRLLGDEQDAQELAQDIMIRTLDTLAQFDRSRSFSSWIYGIARNAAIDRLRRRSLRQSAPLPDEVADTCASPAQIASKRERADLVHKAIMTLEPAYREILVLYHFEHFTYAEIAQTLDLPAGTVMNRMFRARQLLRERIGVQP